MAYNLYGDGLSNKPDVAYFEWVGHNNPGGSGLTNNPMEKPNYENKNIDRHPVKLVTIDSLQLEKLDFIKLDVEGYEVNAIKGMINLLKKDKPMLWIEDNTHTAVPFLEQLGYKVIEKEELTNDYLLA